MDCGPDTATDSNQSSLASTPALELPTNGVDSDGTTLSYSDADTHADGVDDDGSMQSMPSLMASKLDMIRKEPRAKMSMSPNKPGMQPPAASSKAIRKSINNTSFHLANGPRDNEDLGKAVCLKNASQLIEGLLPPVDGASDVVDESSATLSTHTGKENSVPGNGSASTEEGEGKKTDVTPSKDDIARFLSNARQSISPSRLEDPGSIPGKLPKALPRARKSLPSSSRNSPAKMLTTIEEASEQPTGNTANTLTNVTLRLKEIERTLGIKSQTLSKIDAKTLDKLILEKGKPKGRSTPAKEVNDIIVTPATPPVTQNGPSAIVAPSLPVSTLVESESGESEVKVGKKKRRRKGGTYTLPGCKKPIKRLQKPAGLNCRLGSAIKKPGRKAAVVDKKLAVTKAVINDLEGQVYDIVKKPTVKRRKKKSISKKKFLEAKQKKAILEKKNGDTVSTIPVLGTSVPYDDPAYHDSTESEGNYSADEEMNAKLLNKPVVADSPTPMDTCSSSAIPSKGSSLTVLSSTSVVSISKPSSRTDLPVGGDVAGSPSEQKGTKPKRRKKGKGFARKWSQPKKHLKTTARSALSGPLPELIQKQLNRVQNPSKATDVAEGTVTSAADVSSSSFADPLPAISQNDSVKPSISKSLSSVKVTSTTTTTISHTIPVTSDAKDNRDISQTSSAGSSIDAGSSAVSSTDPEAAVPTDPLSESEQPLSSLKESLSRDAIKSRRSSRKRKASTHKHGCECGDASHATKAKRKKPEKLVAVSVVGVSPELSSPILSPIRHDLPITSNPSPNPPVISPVRPLPGKPDVGQIRGQRLNLAATSPVSKAVRGGRHSDSDSEEADQSQDSEDADVGEGPFKPPRYVNTPNGVSYPVTPPKTPENGANICRDVKRMPTLDKDFMPLCCCKINGTTFQNGTQVVYCQALDSIDGKVVGCCNKVSNAQLVRSAIKIPFMAVCEVHRYRLRQHQCCPGCGHFCSQGKFVQCKRDGKALHHFHAQCQIFKDSKHFCPHCGEESSQIEVLLKLNEPRTMSFLDRNLKPQGRPRAKMSVLSGRRSGLNTSELLEEDQLEREKMSDTITAQLVSGAKNLSPEKLAMGPTRTELENALVILNGEKHKKMRAGAKNLFQAAKTEDMEKLLFLLAEGIDPNQKYPEHSNQTALHIAAAKGNTIFVHILLQAGGLPNVADNDLNTPLMNATEEGHLEVMRILIRAGAVVQAKGEDGMTSLHLAAKAGHLEAFKYLVQSHHTDINCKDDGGWTPIIWAAEHGHLQIVKFILGSGGDPNIRDNEENTGLHWAAYAGSLDIAELFLNAGCNLESANERGDRALHIASRQDHYECVVLFLARGADSEVRNNENDSPISCCADQEGQVWLALRVNRQLRSFAAKRLQRPERLLHRDISLGREANPIPVVNEADDENYPSDFQYVTENVETTPMNYNKVITSLQHCRCKDDCSSMFCVCSRNSVRCWYDKEGHLVKEFNQMEPPLIFECNRACRCWANCQNRVVQMGITCRLQVFRTVGRGWGVKTLLNIPAGTFVCEYIGEHLSDAEADSREDDSYLFDLDNKDSDTFCIDARRFANVSRFVNHLCEPNLIPVKVFVEHQDLRFPRICFFSSREIRANEELGFDYGEKFWIIKWKQFTCACGSPKCKYSSETIHRTIEDYNKRQLEEEAMEMD